MTDQGHETGSAPDLKELVRDEITRQRIRDEVEKLGQKPPSRLVTILNHGFTRTLFGFVLTGVIAQWISWSYSAQRDAAELRRDSLTSVRAYSANTREQLSRLESLRAAMIFNRPIEEVRDSWLRYEENFVQWNARHQSDRLVFREFFGFAEHHYLEAVIDAGLYRVLLQLRGCMRHAALDYMAGRQQSAREQMQNGCEYFDDRDVPVTKIMDSFRNCEADLTAVISDHIMQGKDCGSATWRRDGDRVYAQLMSVCVIEGSGYAEREGQVKTAPEHRDRIGYWPYSALGGPGLDADRRRTLEDDYGQYCIHEGGWP